MPKQFLKGRREYPSQPKVLEGTKIVIRIMRNNASHLAETPGSGPLSNKCALQFLIYLPERFF